MTRFAVAAWLALALACSKDAGGDTRTQPAGTGAGPSDTPWFEDVLAESGIDFEHTIGEPRFWFPEIMTGGVGLIDYNGDGRLDVYFVQGGEIEPPPGSAAAGAAAPGNRLYANLGGWRFEDVTESAGVGHTGYGMGCAAGDYDGDGDVDLYVTNLGPDVLYRNEGDGTFTDVTAEAGVDNALWGASAGFVDHDADGDLDLFVVNYVRWTIARDIESQAGSGRRIYAGPNNFNAPASDVLFENLGDGKFRDTTRAAGLGAAFGNGLGCAFGDFDGDGDVDIYVANDDWPNQLWLQGPRGQFTDEALQRGCAVNATGTNEAGMGVQAADIDVDGDLDLFLSHLRGETNTFYANLGRYFEDATTRTGLGPPSQAYTGFGLGFADFDHDGALDVYVANGRVRYYDPPLAPDDEHAEPNLLLRGRSGLRFEEVLPRGGTAPELVYTSRAAALGDLDGDGGVDVVVVNRNARPSLLRNLAGARGNWIAFDVREADGRLALGARVRVSAKSRVQYRQVQVAYGYCATHDPRVHFGLDQATAAEVTVRWPDGSEQSFGNLDAGRVHALTRE